MCCNVLEHVPNAGQLATAIQRLVAPNGYALVSVPFRFPYHPGPIDTLLRPSVDDLRRLFPELTETSAAEIRCESLLTYWLASPRKWTALAWGLRSFAGPRQAPAAPRRPLAETVRMVLSSTAVTAAIFRRE